MLFVGNKLLTPKSPTARPSEKARQRTSKRLDSVERERSGRRGSKDYPTPHPPDESAREGRAFFRIF